MPGPLIAKPQLPEWADPANRSVFDYPGQGLLRTVVGLLGLDDPNQVMMAGGMVEAGPMTGGLVAAVKAKAPEVIEAVAQRLPRFAKAIQAYHGSPTKAGVVSQPFYSRLDEAAATLPKSTFGPKITGLVQKGQASTEELAARGVPEFVASHGNKPITKAALEAHLEAHPVPQLDVKTLGADLPGVNARRAAIADRLDELATSEPLTAAHREESRQLSEELSAPRRPPKFSRYQLPGGENYRETLITLPNAKPDAYSKAVKAYEAKHGPNYRNELTNREINDLDALGGDTSQHSQYRSSHFDEPNILAHTRSNERTLPGLGKGTFLEEVQSDWHQAGKSHGYQGTASETPGTQAPGWGTIGESRSVPDAPFKETWPDLALKHHLAEAAENPDVHWLGFTSGETQAARYNLSKQVSQIDYAPSGPPDRRVFKLGAVDMHGDGVAIGAKDTFTAAELPDVVGKELAQKIINGEGKAGGGRMTLSGVDLKVGGEGMHAFYDNLLPKRLEKIVKPYGGTVERATAAQTGNKDLVGAWILKLTPELKAKIRAGGLPLMTGLGAVELAREDK